MRFWQPIGFIVTFAFISLWVGSANLMAEETKGVKLLNKATQKKVLAENLADFNKVIELLEQAQEEGLEAEEAQFAEDLLLSSLMQRAEAMSGAILGKPLPDPRKDPRWMQIRRFALNDLSRITTMKKDLWDAHLLIGRLQSMPLGNKKLAKESLTKGLNISDLTPEKKAEIYAWRSAAQETKEDQIKDLTEAILLNKKEWKYLLQRSFHYLSEKKYEKALEDTNKAFELDEKNAVVYNLRGMIFKTQNKLDAAVTEFLKAVTLNKAFVGAHQQLANIYKAQKKHDLVSQQFDILIKLQPKNMLNYINRAQTRVLNDDLEGALQDVEVVLAAYPTFVLAHRMRAQILLLSDRVDEAIRLLEEVVRLTPNQVDLQLQLGACYMIKKEHQKSIDVFTAVIKITPKKAEAYRYRGDVYLSLGEHKKAVADLVRSHKIEDKNSGLLNNLAWVLSTSHKEDVRNGKDGLKYALQASKLTEHKQPHILSTLAAAYAETGDFKNAIKWAKKSLELYLALPKEVRDSRDREPGLEKEIASYEAGKPWRENQADQVEVAPPESENSVEPDTENAPARTIDF